MEREGRAYLKPMIGKILQTLHLASCLTENENKSNDYACPLASLDAHNIVACIFQKDSNFTVEKDYSGTRSGNQASDLSKK